MLVTEQNPSCEGLGALRGGFRLALESRLQIFFLETLVLYVSVKTNPEKVLDMFWDFGMVKTRCFEKEPTRWT